MTGIVDEEDRGAYRPRGRVYARAALIIASTMVPAMALGATQVSGTKEAVTVEAQNSSIKEILSALSQQFNVHLESTARLEKQVSGTYDGTLRHVLERLLVGYNFIIRARDGQLQITILGGSASSNGLASTSAANGGAPPQPPMRAAQGQPTATPTVAGQSVGPAQAPPSDAADQSKTESAEGLPKPGGPVPTIMVAEGPAPTPAPAGSSVGGPVVGPATTTMPMPSPGPATGGASLPMPAASPTPFPGITPSTSPPPPVPNSSTSSEAVPNPSTAAPTADPSHSPTAPTPQKQ
jgi:hypothetical protein